MNNHINYIEFAVSDITATKEFYTNVFGWEFTDYSDDYVAFENKQKSGMAGGFHTQSPVVHGGPLVVLYHDDLEMVEQKIRDAGGNITKDLFQFPGGERFEFTDPSGHALAVWRHTK